MDVDYASFPSILRPIVGSDGEESFADLSTKENKAKVTTDVKSSIVKLISDHSFTIREISQRYRLVYSTVKAWRIVKNKGLPFLDPHRPRFVSKDELQRLKESVAAGSKSKKHVLTKNFSKMCLEAHARTLSKTHPPEEVKYRVVKIQQKGGPDKRTVRSIIIEAGIKERTAQPITEARFKAMICPRVSYTWASLLMAYAGDLPAENKWNADATTFEIRKELTNTNRILVVEEDVHIAPKNINDTLQLNPDVPRPYKYILRKSDDLTCSFIKWVHLANAAGDISNLVFIIAVNGMDPEDCLPVTVPGLTLGPGSSVGYLIFCNSRCGNAKVWNWYFKNIVIATIKDKQELYQNNLRAMFYTDGEAIVLEQGVNNEIEALFKSNKIDYLKGPPSASGSHQACDRAATFKVIKREMGEHKEVRQNSTLRRQLDKAFTALKAHCNEASPDKEKIKYGLERLLDAMSNKALSKNEVRNGFEVCGQHREIDPDLVLDNPEEGLAYSSIDFDLVMRQCFSYISPTEKEKMKTALPKMIEIMRLRGRATDKEMHLHICRDNFVLWRQHSQVVHCEDALERQRNLLRERFIRTDPEQKKLAAEKAAAEKTIKAYESSQQKKKPKKEKESTTTSSKEEKAAEKQAKAEREREKKEKAKKEYEAAKLYLSQLKESA